MAGNIHRQKKNRDFVTIDTHCLRNKDLRWDAKGLHSYLMQLPDDWKINVADLEKRSLDRHDGTMSPMRALISAGYVYRERISGEKGRFVGYDYHLFERPEQTVEWLTVNGKSIDGKTVNGKSATSKVLKPLSEVSKNEVEGERNTPAPNPSNLKEEKKENGLVAPGRCGAEEFFAKKSAEYPETVKAEIPPSKKVAPKKDSPENNLGFCGSCAGRGYFNEPHGKEQCGECGGSGDSNAFAELEAQNAAHFEVTAIASPTELPGVTLVEAAPFADENGKTWHDGTQLVQAAPIHHRRNGRIEIPDEAAAEILPWANGDGAQTVKGWYSRAFRAWSPSDVESMVFKFSTVFLSSEKAATRNMMETDPLAFFKKRFSGFIVDQPSFDRFNAPKEGGQTRTAQPAQNVTSKMRQL